jgi:hypothetical protein
MIMLRDITRDGRRDRIEEIKEWMQEVYDEFRDQEFPEYIQREWDLGYAELLDHEAQLANLEARDRTLARMASEWTKRNGS